MPPCGPRADKKRGGFETRPYEILPRVLALRASACLRERAPEAFVLLAAAAAELLELRELGLGGLRVAHLEIELAQILVGAAVIGVERERLLIPAERDVVIAELAVAVGEIVHRIDVLRLLGHDLLELLDRLF